MRWSKRGRGVRERERGGVREREGDRGEGVREGVRQRGGGGVRERERARSLPDSQFVSSAENYRLNDCTPFTKSQCCNKVIIIVFTLVKLTHVKTT